MNKTVQKLNILNVLLCFALTACSTEPGKSDTDSGSQNVADESGNRVCGGFAGLSCGPEQICLRQGGTCDVLDGGGPCVERPRFCLQVALLVCGCDGETYMNARATLVAGVIVDHDGACGTAN